MTIINISRKSLDIIKRCWWSGVWNVI